MIGEVYFFQSETGPIKIGFSQKVEERIRQLELATKEPLECLVTLDGDKRTEFFFHNKYRNCNIIGEWFRPEKEILDDIEVIKKEGVDFVPEEFKPVYEFRYQPQYDNQDIKAICHDYCQIIAGPRFGSQRILDLIKIVSDITGFSFRKSKQLWYGEFKVLKTHEFLKLKEIAEAIVANRKDYESNTRLYSNTLNNINQLNDLY